MLGALIGVLSVALIFLIARATLGERTARIAGWFAALFPPLVVLNASLLSEALFLPLMLAAILATLRFRADPARLWPAAAAGALIGLAALSRSTGLLLDGFDPFQLLIAVTEWVGGGLATWGALIVRPEPTALPTPLQDPTPDDLPPAA